MISTDDRDDFVRGFIAATLWANSYGDTPTGEAPCEADADRLSPEDRATLTAFAVAFLGDYASELRLFCEAIPEREDGMTYTRHGLDYGQAGHDLALTGAGHGAGFWDRGAGDVGDRLSEAAKLHGYFMVAVSDDGALSVHEG